MDSPSKLEEIESAFRSLFARGEIDEFTFCKGLVQIAHGWVLHGNKNRASGLVGNLTHKYVDRVLPEQMEADPAFRSKAVAVGAAIGGELDEGEVEIDFALLTKEVAKA